LGSIWWRRAARQVPARGLRTTSAFLPESPEPQAARVRAQREAVREAERAQRAYERAAAADEKERKRLYQESRLAKAAAMTDDVESTVSALEGLLAAGLGRCWAINFSQLHRNAVFPPFEPGQLGQPLHPPSVPSHGSTDK
jgi:restriction system protein